MPRRNRKTRRLDGRHKRAGSPETRKWDREHLIPKRPSWMPQDVYQKLRDIREGA